jgi:hypothetical protein
VTGRRTVTILNTTNKQYIREEAAVGVLRPGTSRSSAQPARRRQLYKITFKGVSIKEILKRFFKIFSVCFIFVSAVPAHSAHLTWAQYKAVFKAYRYPATGSDSLMYRLCMPYHYDTTVKYPLVICLHGVGERGSDDSIQIKNNCLATVWADSTVQNPFPHFIVAPQCPAGSYQWTQCSWNQTVVNYDTIPLSKPVLKHVFTLSQDGR